MEKNKNRSLGKIEELANLAEQVQNMFDGRAMVVFELEKTEYKSMISYFREIDRHHEQFSIDISGTEFHFILKKTEEK